ncbi:MAG: MBL fold metallo-hydrolase [Anaerovoracaceae bacterium]
MIRYYFLAENKTENPACMAEHGLSIYIEADDKKILLDAGTTDLMIKNAEIMGVDLSSVDFAVISHGHFDHIGGFPTFCKINNHAPIYLHKNGLRKTHRQINGIFEEKIWGMSWSDKDYNDIKERIIPVDGPIYITPEICVTGTVPYTDGDKMLETFYYKDEQENYIVDDMSHEQCLVIKQPEGLYIFSGCSHRGAMTALEGGKACFPGEKVAAFIAGMHLFNADDEKINTVVGKLKKDPPEAIIPMHCTGTKALCKFLDAFGDKCIIAMTGDGFEKITKL